MENHGPPYDDGKVLYFGIRRLNFCKENQPIRTSFHRDMDVIISRSPLRRLATRFSSFPPGNNNNSDMIT